MIRDAITDEDVEQHAKRRCGENFREPRGHSRQIGVTALCKDISDRLDMDVFDLAEFQAALEQAVAKVPKHATGLRIGFRAHDNDLWDSEAAVLIYDEPETESERIERVVWSLASARGDLEAQAHHERAEYMRLKEKFG